jgi:hypothetical protein
LDKIDETEKKLKEENKVAFISQTTIWKPFETDNPQCIAFN